MTHLLCEDFDQIPGSSGGFGEFRFPKSQGPQPYACPQCGGSLEVDGSVRMVKCIHCDTSLHIPDNLLAEAPSLEARLAVVPLV